MLSGRTLNIASVRILRVVRYPVHPPLINLHARPVVIEPRNGVVDVVVAALDVRSLGPAPHGGDLENQAPRTG